MVGTNEDVHHLCPRPATSTPYSPIREHASCNMSTPRPTHPVCLETPAMPAHRTAQEGRPSYRPAAPIQRFNNKTISWPAWFRHFKAVADIHGWDKDQRALQLVSYLDETAMNVAQELSDKELYNYDVLIKLLGDRFDPASRVSASRSRFHGRTRPVRCLVTSRIWWNRHVGIWTPHNDAALPPSCWNIRIYSRCPEPHLPVIQTLWSMTLIRVTGHPYAVHHDECLLRR